MINIKISALPLLFTQRVQFPPNAAAYEVQLPSLLTLFSGFRKLKRRLNTRTERFLVNVYESGGLKLLLKIML